MPTVRQALPLILSDLREYGDEVGSRNGRVKELLNTQIVITDPTQREVLNPHRKANVFAQIAETMWVLFGRNDIKWLSAYLPRAEDYSDDGETWRAGYGPRIRSNYKGVDQLARVVEMLSRDPLSRQAVIQIWDVSDGSLEPLKDRACNTQLQFQSRGGKLHLTVTVRSNDVMWGWSGINAFEWSTMQEIVASVLGIQVGELVFNIGSLHLYDRHWERARRITGADNVGSAPYNPVRFDPNHNITSLGDVDLILGKWFEWENLCREGEVSPNLLRPWESPLLKSWAAAIAYFWTRNEVWLSALHSTALAAAIAQAPASVFPEPVVASQSRPVGVSASSTLSEPTRAFYEYVRDMHAVKHGSYGDSWKKRGEKLSILANMARKVDRLGVGDLFDSGTDTWVDLMVYSAKYLCWLDDKHSGPKNVNPLLGEVLSETEDVKPDVMKETHSIRVDFDRYADNVDGLDQTQKRLFTADLLKRLAPIARDMWVAEDDYKGADFD